MPLKPHPKDPKKMVYKSRKYNLPKPWVGLTDKEIQNFLIEPVEKNLYTFARFIEKTLKEKNA